MTHTRDVDSPLVTFPPDVAAGAGRIERHLDPYGVVADLDLTVCHACRLAVIEHVRTDPPHRRRGYGRELVTAAVGHGPGCDWSTTRVDTLQGAKGVYRIRVGDYRVLYTIRDSELVVLIVDLGHRREIYDQL